jgi:DNA-binding NtrC family response regulator
VRNAQIVRRVSIRAKDFLIIGPWPLPDHGAGSEVLTLRADLRSRVRDIQPVRLQRWDKKRAAALLGISRTTLYSALRTYDITTTSVSRS